MILDFEKWHGAKNDFILLWLPDDAMILESLRSNAVRLCSREGDGIGADGILVLTRSSDRQNLMPEKLTIINSDGSLAATCGNGIRVAALSTLKRHYDSEMKVEIPEAFELKLLEGSVVCRYLGSHDLSHRRLHWPHVSVDMGVPKIDAEHPWFEQAKAVVLEQAAALGIKELENDWHLVDIGNHHLVFFLDEIAPELVRIVGPAFQKSDLWDGINVHLAAPKAVDNELRRLSAEHLGQSVEELYEVVVWERGAGETKACGSGACSVVKAVLASGMVEKNQWVACQMPGGVLYARQDEDDEPITLAGPGALVFTGQFEL